MWNRKRSTFLIIKIKIPSRFGFTFPLLLPVVEETLEELTDWMAFYKWVYNRESSWVSATWKGLHAGRDILNEIRAQEPIDMALINTPDAIIAVKLR